MLNHVLKDTSFIQVVPASFSPVPVLLFSTNYYSFSFHAEFLRYHCTLSIMRLLGIVPLTIWYSCFKCAQFIVALAVVALAIASMITESQISVLLLFPACLITLFINITNILKAAATIITSFYFIFALIYPQRLYYYGAFLTCDAIGVGVWTLSIIMSIALSVVYDQVLDCRNVLMHGIVVCGFIEL